MHPDSCGPPNKYHTSSTEQKPPAHPHCIHYNITSREAWLHCVSTPSSLLPQKKIGGHGLGVTGAHKGMACRILSNAPLGNESPAYRQCEQLHPKREIEVLGRWSKRARSPANSLSVANGYNLENIYIREVIQRLCLVTTSYFALFASSTSTN